MNAPTMNQRIFGTFLDVLFVGLLATALALLPLLVMQLVLEVDVPEWFNVIPASGIVGYLLFFSYRVACEYRGTPTLGRGTAGPFVMEFRSQRLPRVLAVVIRNGAILLAVAIFLVSYLILDRHDESVDMGWIYLFLWVTMLAGRDRRHVLDRLAGAYPVEYVERAKDAVGQAEQD